MPHTRRSTWCSLRRLGPARRCAVFVRSGMRCTWCDIELEQWNAQVDHVISRARGGEDRNDNLVGSCADCNQRRPVPWRMPTAQLRQPLDLAAGKALALAWYPWAAARLAAKGRVLSESKEAVKMRRLRAKWKAEGLAGADFPFGANS